MSVTEGRYYGKGQKRPKGSALMPLAILAVLAGSPTAPDMGGRAYVKGPAGSSLILPLGTALGQANRQPCDGSPFDPSPHDPRTRHDWVGNNKRGAMRCRRPGCEIQVVVERPGSGA